VRERGDATGLLRVKASGMGAVTTTAGTADGDPTPPCHKSALPAQRWPPHLRSEKKVGYTTRGATRTVTVGTPMFRR
jgi:hypothetical protein